MVRKDVEVKKSIIDLFLTKFTLTEEEAGIIKSGDAPIGTRFFQVMDKIDKIRDDCRVLMVGEEGPTQSGCASFYLFPRPIGICRGTHMGCRIDIMSTTSSYLEHSYGKLFRWTSHKFRQVGGEMQVEIDPTLCEAIHRLKKRPELLTYALCEVLFI